MDDNKVIRQLIRVILESEGFEVVTAADGAECLEVVHQVEPDVITLDVVMPRLDGLRTAALLRADPRTRALPLLIVSGCTPQEVDSGCEVAVDGYLAKPFEPAELVRFVRRLLERGAEAEGMVPAARPRVPEHGGLGDLGGLGRPGDLGQHSDLGEQGERAESADSGDPEPPTTGGAAGSSQAGRGAQGSSPGEAERAAWGSGG